MNTVVIEMSDEVQNICGVGGIVQKSQAGADVIAMS